jgi:AraC-like DNA-binding protein
MADFAPEQINEPVPLAFARALLVQANAYGVNTELMLEAAGFPFDPMDPPDTPVFVSVEQYSRLCAALFQAIGDESGGVIDGSTTPYGTTRLLLFAVLRCTRLQQALERAIEFNACCRERQGEVQINDLEIDSENSLVTLRYLSAPRQSKLPLQDGVLCGLSMWLRLCGWLIGQYIDVVSATCAGPQPENLSSLRHFFPCPVTFDAPYNSLTFSARHLEAELIRSEAELEEFMRVAPYHVVIKPVASDASVTSRIRIILGSDLGRELPSFEELTAALNMSPRTLRRRLEKEGTSYQKIKDNARRDVAISLLSRDQLTVSDVAERVGFSDPSAFHRSFKKWTGQSPGAYR